MSKAKVRTRDDVLAELRAVASVRHTAQREADEQYARQVELYVEARAFEPPILLREIADAAQAKVVAVDAAITKLLTKRAVGNGKP